MIKSLVLLTIVALIVCNSACAGGKGRVKIDPVTQSTVLDGDATGMVEACGSQPIVGFTYCRVQEGDNAGQFVSFIGPPAKCNQEASCVFIKVWNNQGQLIWGGSIPKKETRVNVTWKTLLGRDQFQISDRGFWTWNTQVFWLDPDGRERESSSQGDIVLRAYRKGYLPLNDVQTDSNFVWRWIEGNFLYQMTSGLRGSIQRVKK